METQSKLNTGEGAFELGLPYPKKRTFDKDETVYLPHISSDTYLKAVEYENKQRELKSRFRNWSLINEKQAKQDLYAWDLISLMVDSLEIPVIRNRTGRPPANPSDQLKLAILKIYNKSSFRRQHSFNTIYSNSGYTTKLLRRTAVNAVFIEDSFTGYLEEIYRRLADLLIPFENTFAIDSSGFGTRYNSRWVKVRLDFQKHRDYKKVHIICGTNTHIITEVKILEGTSADSPQLPELFNATAKRFKIKRLCADSGYLSRENVQIVTDAKARPFIMPKINSIRASKGYGAWYKMIRMWQEQPERFSKEYHLRSNVESVFSMMKTTLLDGISSKTIISQKNELLIRVICHNLSVVIDAIFRFGIDPYSK